MVDGVWNSCWEGKALRKLYFQMKYITAFILALFAVIITSPLMGIIALAIKIEDGGSVLFKQQRTGFHGRKFMCYKFRSMKSDHVEYNKNKRVIKDSNPNLTKAGKVIRKFKLDELPQLFNVLRGEMCLIGPRPLLPVFDGDYEGWELAKYEMRPGLTGLGQVYGNGHLSIKARKYYDAYYVLHSSLFLDIKIAFKTVAVMIVGERRFLRRVKCEEYAALRKEIENNFTISPETYKNFGMTPPDKAADGKAAPPEGIGSENNE